MRSMCASFVLASCVYTQSSLNKKVAILNSARGEIEHNFNGKPAPGDLFASQTTMFPREVAESARDEFRQKTVWLNMPTGLLKSWSVNGGAK